MTERPKLLQLDRQLGMLADELDNLRQELGSSHAEARRSFLRRQIVATEADRAQLQETRALACIGSVFTSLRPPHEERAG